MSNENGNRLQSALNQLGLNVEFVGQVIEPHSQLATYYFNYKNIKDYSKTKLQAFVDKLSMYYHIRFEITNSDIAHFGLSMPNRQRKTLWLGSLTQPENKYAINVGKDLSNKDVILDFTKIPHLLIAGTTGSGKSVLVNSILSSLYINLGGDNFDLMIIDPKRTDFRLYGELPNCDFVDETTDAIAKLNDLVYTMEERYSEQANGKFDQKHIFVVVDELADLMLTSRYEVEENLMRLAQKSRAANIHLILATQRPTVNVLTGSIKSNLPNRICLKMASQIDSRTVLDHKGAETLLGFGDAILKLDGTTNEIRFQCAMISKENVKNCIEGVLKNANKEIQRQENSQISSNS